MSLLKIARMGHPVLRQDARTIEPEDIEHLQGTIDDMIETMHDASGIGLAAPQVYLPLRLIVFLPIDLRSERVPEPVVLINPEFEPLSDDMVTDWEGCLSIPDLRGKVARYAQIRYTGLGPDGEPISTEASGLHARVVQHEIDHLHATLYLDRMSDMKSLMFISETRHHKEDTGDD